MEKEIWIYAHWNQYSKETEYQLSPYTRHESSGDVLLEQRIISFDTPNDKELRKKLSKTLAEKLSIMRAEHYKEQAEMQETINELLSLEYKPEVKDEDVL